MVNCSFSKCSNRVDRNRDDYKRGIKFYSIPKVVTHQCDKTKMLSERRRMLWLARISRKDLRDSDVKTYTKVCSEHFVTGTPSKLFDETNPDWAPSLKLGYGTAVDTNAVVKAASRYERCKRRSEKKLPANSIVLPIEEPAMMILGNQVEERNQPEPDNSTPVHEDFSVERNCNADCSEDNLQFGNDLPNESATDDNIVPVDPATATTTDSYDDQLEAVQKQCSELRQDYMNVCNKAKKLRDQVTDLDVDKYELQASLKCSEENAKILQLKVNEMEDVIKRQQEALEKETKLRQETEEKLMKFLEEIRELRQQVLNEEKKTFTNLEVFSADESKVRFYTGLPSYAVFKVLVDGMTSYLKEQSVDTSRFVLEPWQGLLLTLMRLRLAVTLQDLAYRFGVSKATAIRGFDRYIDAMYHSVYPLLVQWPDRETLWKTMPRGFRESYGNSVAVIIDCFEVFTEKPSSLESRAMIWSNYKHHHTVKILIGISPTGAITFVSTAWGARASDKHVVAESGLYELLLPYDVVMADRGFNIAEHLALHHAKLLIPAFTRGQDQLSSHDIALTRKIANLRIHVERVIGLVRRKYRILKSILPHEMLIKKPGEEFAPIDKIVRVCCALVNMCPSIVVHPDLHDQMNECEASSE